MDWLIIAACCILPAAALAVRMQQLKKDIYSFTQKLEECLDELLSGRELPPPSFEQDTLWEKIYEKLFQAGRIFQQKEETYRKEKQQLKEMISDISHQTKTPAANLKVYLEMLADTVFCEETPDSFPAECLQRMAAETDKLEFLLQGLVKMSRLETGILEIKKEKADLFQTLCAAISAAVPEAEAKQIRISADCPNPVFVCHDAKWTQEALFNVIDNAVKYTGRNGRICIKVSVQEVFTKISIKDTGPGICAGHQAQIFQRFYREPCVHEQEGIGIGLYLTRKILELQCGYIEVCSDIGKGADFHIYLKNEPNTPLQAADYQACSAAEQLGI